MLDPSDPLFIQMVGRGAGPKFDENVKDECRLFIKGGKLIQMKFGRKLHHLSEKWSALVQRPILFTLGGTQVHIQLRQKRPSVDYLPQLRTMVTESQRFILTLDI